MRGTSGTIYNVTEYCVSIVPILYLNLMLDLYTLQMQKVISLLYSENVNMIKILERFYFWHNPIQILWPFYWNRTNIKCCYQIQFQNFRNISFKVGARA